MSAEGGTRAPARAGGLLAWRCLGCETARAGTAPDRCPSCGARGIERLELTGRAHAGAKGGRARGGGAKRGDGPANPFARRKRGHKYGAIPAWRCLGCGGDPGVPIPAAPCSLCGAEAVERMDSRAEARRYDRLRQQSLAGEIRDLRVHVPIPLVVEGPEGPRQVGIYEADFVYVDVATGEEVVEDVKGLDTAASRLKRRMVEAMTGSPVHVIRDGAR